MLICLLCFLLGIFMGAVFSFIASHTEADEGEITVLAQGSYSDVKNPGGVMLTVEKTEFVLYENSKEKARGTIAYDNNNTFSLVAQGGEDYRLYAIDARNILLFTDNSAEAIVDLEKVSAAIIRYPQNSAAG